MSTVGIHTCLLQIRQLVFDHHSRPSNSSFGCHIRTDLQLRCTYRAYDAMDEITTASSTGFNPCEQGFLLDIINLFGYLIYIAQAEILGNTPHLKEIKKGDQASSRQLPSSPTNTGKLAAGSYNQTTGIYREDNMELLYVLHGQEGGVTHVQFSKDGHYLHTGGRKDPYILFWDTRKTVEVVYKLYRSTESTNQRILFDIEPLGRHLGTGGQDGLVHIYDLQTGQWISSFQAASDTVNGFSFHPYLPMAASSSGQRRFEAPHDSNDNVCLTGNENCTSIWSFFCSSMGDDTTEMNLVDGSS